MKAETKLRRISGGSSNQPVADDIQSLRRRWADEAGSSAVAATEPWWTPIEGTIWSADANIGRVVFMMPPVSQVDAEACAKPHTHRILIISDAKPPIISIGNPSLNESTV